MRFGFISIFVISALSLALPARADSACTPNNYVEATVCHYVDAWNARQIDTVLELFSDDAPYVGPAQIGYVRSFMPKFMRQVLEAMPDVYIRVHKMTVEQNEHVSVQWSAVGTNTGYFQNSAPNHQVTTITGTDIFHVRFQRIVSLTHSEHHIY